MPGKIDTDGLNELGGVIATTIFVLNQAEDLCTEVVKDQDVQVEVKPEINAVHVARDTALLIRAHATKLSLLIINEPFTPTVIADELRRLMSGPIPGLVSAIQLCEPVRYTATYRRELASLCGRLFNELHALVEKIPVDGNVLTGHDKDSSADGSLVLTGRLWSVCDEVVRFANLGIAGHLVKKVEGLRSILLDMVQELKEWSEETPDNEEDDDDDDDDDSDVKNGNEDDAHSDNGNTDDATSAKSKTDDVQALVDEWMNPSVCIPAGDPDNIRPRLDSCMRRLRLTGLLYQAIVKRRLQTLPPLPLPAGSTKQPGEVGTGERLDGIMAQIQKMTEASDEIVASFYGLDAEVIDQLVDGWFEEGVRLSDLARDPWDKAAKDGFAEWVEKYQVEVRKSS